MNKPMKRTVKLAVLLCLLLLAPTLQAAPEPAKTTQLDGDVITYTSKTGVMTAKGGVKLTQGNAVMTGDSGEYNTKTKEALMTGNVKAVKEGSTLTAAEVRSYDDMKRLVATGDALLVRKDSTAAGPRMEYFPDRQYANITGGARLTNKDAVLTSKVAEAFFQEDRATADGNVHIVSEARKLDAVSDHAVYYGINGKNGKADLIGNARVVQDGNVLTGNHVIMYLDDSAMDTEGRSKLVIQPKKTAPAPKEAKP
ncbi:MAG: LPS export ABC transporter periplasmic protein LptC [Veillonellaceae bacterium]|nr:LPS export ABC transporter periplasmic protein LptC [Veillonellaceae bacterium]